MEKNSSLNVPEVGTQANFHGDQLSDLKLNQHKQQYNSNLQKLRQEEGLALPMKMSMERYAVRLVGSQLMDDVLTGRCHTIGFEDFIKRPKRAKDERPHQAQWEAF